MENLAASAAVFAGSADIAGVVKQGGYKRQVHGSFGEFLAVQMDAMQEPGRGEEYAHGMGPIMVLGVTTLEILYQAGEEIANISKGLVVG